MEPPRIRGDPSLIAQAARMQHRADQAPSPPAKDACTCGGHVDQCYVRVVSVLQRIAARAGNSTRRIAVHLPFLAAKELVYDRAYYEALDGVHRPLYRLLADTVDHLFEPRTAVDVGCGTGLILSRLQERGVQVAGIEGSRHAIESSGLGDRVVKANLERSIPRLGRFDVCFCIEVAEHLPARAASPLVDALTSLSDIVVFTAATPGQGGSHHVNEQPQSYWETRFAERGFRRDGQRESQLKTGIASIAKPAWMHQNLMLFARG